MLYLYNIIDFISVINKHIKLFICIFLTIYITACLNNNATAQRVYANAQQNSATIFASVTNPGRAIDADTSNSSALNVAIGFGGLVSAQQNLQFTTAGQKPIATTPIFVKFHLSALGSFLDDASLQTTNNNNLVGAAYGGGQLGDFLGLFPTGDLVRLPAQNTTYDGVRLTISIVFAGGGLTANYYYAFFIIAPVTSDATICSGTAAILPITNFQAGYTYKLYDGSTVVSTSTTNTISTPVLTTGSTTTIKTYQLVAWDNGIYDSGLTPVTVTINPKPAGTISAASPICEGQPTQLLFNATAGTAPYSLIINSTTYSNIQSNMPFNTVPNATVTTTYSLTQITDNNTCTNP